ncbi:unnamed protein product [Gongylonema pulchrum]|uniref:CsbD family protein n=1 Tax=Gongylonema pulchrum TaxID=637853 RepID=A0A183EL19_9BILA|nr:unnamed protein product [Gongylonema pulchrum]
MHKGTEEMNDLRQKSSDKISNLQQRGSEKVEELQEKGAGKVDDLRQKDSEIDEVKDYAGMLFVSGITYSAFPRTPQLA